MNILQILESKNPGYKPGEPYWDFDSENKVYTVHLSDGTEVGRYPFQHVWDSSPAMRRAKEHYSKVFSEYRNKKEEENRLAAERKPLSPVEQKYFQLSQSVSKYQRYIYPKTPGDDILDKETRDLYIEKATEWLNQMNRLASGGSIRRSLIDGTYKAPD